MVGGVARAGVQPQAVLSCSGLDARVVERVYAQAKQGPLPLMDFLGGLAMDQEVRSLF